jgi:hypothetical protein
MTIFFYPGFNIPGSFKWNMLQAVKSNHEMKVAKYANVTMAQ